MIQPSTWFKFRVVSLNSEAFKRAAKELAVLASGFEPNIIIGIRSGGHVLAGLMQETVSGVVLLPITCRRSSTQHKSKYDFIKKLLACMPHFITNKLRIAEHIMLTQCRSATPSIPAFDQQELADIKKCLAQHGASARVLIVDDAVDRGATLLAVRSAVNSIANPDAAIRMAAITVTTVAPLIEPDFSLYRYVLCRFPWSLDSRT